MRKLFIALPAMDEAATLPQLIADLQKQTLSDFRLFVCINQPEDYWQHGDKKHICESNRISLDFLHKLNDSRITVLDRSSRGNGWTKDLHGIGAARKFIMDLIAVEASPDDLIVSIDADTHYEPGFFQSIVTNFEAKPNAIALSVPYYHCLTGVAALDRAMLRYELYMRSYAINMWRIGSPYCFTALGSAIALPVWAYKKIGGMTPKMSGEDFYFLQKLVKAGQVMHWNREIAFPAARLSERVFFGTGPALIKGLAGNWDSYPVYHPFLFDWVYKLYQLFETLFDTDVSTPLDAFLISKSNELPWPKLRKNFKSKAHFIRACHEKIDGLRILQYLKLNQPSGETAISDALKQLLSMYSMDYTECNVYANADFNFLSTGIDMLNQMRDLLFMIEMDYRRKHWESFSKNGR